MTSVWGVEHGVVSKSRIPGAGFKAITAMSTAERAGLKASLKPKKMGGRKGNPLNPFDDMLGRLFLTPSDRYAAPRQLHWAPRKDKELTDTADHLAIRRNLLRKATGVDTAKPTQGVKTIKTKPSFNNATVAVYGPKKGPTRGEYMIGTPKFLAQPNTRKHELMHSSNRSSWRLAQIERDPMKLAREEARADTLSGTHRDFYLTGRSHTDVHRRAASNLHSAQRRADKSAGEHDSGTFAGVLRETRQAVDEARLGVSQRGAEFRRVQDKIDPSAGAAWKQRKRQRKAIGAGVLAGGVGGAVGYNAHQQRDQNGRWT